MRWLPILWARVRIPLRPLFKPATCNLCNTRVFSVLINFVRCQDVSKSSELSGIISMPILAHKKKSCFLEANHASHWRENYESSLISCTFADTLGGCSIVLFNLFWSYLRTLTHEKPKEGWICLHCYPWIGPLLAEKHAGGAAVNTKHRRLKKKKLYNQP